jgi:hypothetical protein
MRDGGNSFQSEQPGTVPSQLERTSTDILRSLILDFYGEQLLRMGDIFA